MPGQGVPNTLSAHESHYQGVIFSFLDARGLAPETKERVSQLRKQLLKILEEYISANSPNNRQRFPLLLLRLTNIKAISFDVVQHMEMHRTLGDAHLDQIFVELLDTAS